MLNLPFSSRVMRLMAMPSCSALFFLLHLHFVISAYGIQPVITITSKSRAPPPAAALLSHNFYQRTCPDAEGIIHRKVLAWIQKDFTLAPALIRLHFHDCAVRVRIHYMLVLIYLYTIK